MQNDMLKGLLGSIAFAVAGALSLVFTDLSLVARIMVWAVIIFFGLGAIVIAIRIARQPFCKPAYHPTIPKNIKVEQLVPADEEVEEQWSHSSPTQPLLDISASKWKEVSEYRWKINVYLAALAPDGESAQILDLPIYQALKSTKNVVDVCRDDTEVWIVSGDPNGKDLVTNVGAALGQCIPSIVPRLLHDQQNT